MTAPQRLRGGIVTAEEAGSRGRLAGLCVVFTSPVDNGQVYGNFTCLRTKAKLLSSRDSAVSLTETQFTPASGKVIPSTRWWSGAVLSPKVLVE